jgi:hypothetical protein
MENNKTWMETVGKIGLVLLVSLVVIVSHLIYHAGRFKGITDINALDYAQVARNVSQGEGFTTNIVRPLSLCRVPRIEKHPELTFAPLHPYIASLFMRMMPDKDRAIALSCGMGFLLTAPVVFFLGWQLFDIRTGYLSVALYATNTMLLRYSISGLEVMWLGLWCSLLLLVLHALSRKQRWRIVLAGIAGLLLALIYLTQYLWIVILLPVLVFVFISSEKTRRWQACIVLLLVFAVVIAPWCVRNAQLTGNPFFTFRVAESIMGTRTNPGNTLYRQFTDAYPSWAWYLMDRPLEVLEKVRDGLQVQYMALPQIAGGFLSAFFVVSIIVSLGTKTFERVRYLWYAMFAVLVLALAVVAPDQRLIAPLAPFATVVAAGFFLRLLNARIEEPVQERRQRYLNLGIGVLIVIHALPLGFDLFRFREVTPEQRAVVGAAQAAREAAGVTDGPIVTDVPWIMAWYADRTAVWLPKTTGDLRNIEDKLGKIPWLMLTPQVASRQYDIQERTIRDWGTAYLAGREGDTPFEGYIPDERVVAGGWVLYHATPGAPRDLPAGTAEDARKRLGATEEAENQPGTEPSPAPSR